MEQAEIQRITNLLNKSQYFSELKVPEYAVHTEKKIKGFFGEFRFLSNFYECSNGIWYEGLKYPTVEHAYQASKVEKEDRAKFLCCTVKEVKKMGNAVFIANEDWEKIKYNIMLQLVTQKFATHDKLRDKLISTGNAYLEETNAWGDTYWGVFNGVGENRVGKILMTVRKFWSDVI